MKALIALLLFSGLQVGAQDMQSCPMHKEHMKAAWRHQADVEKHGDEAMGFSHDKTTYHFRLYSDEGAIEVTANDSKDSQSTQAIRSHLTHIATMFSNGEFSIPMFVHGPGAARCFRDEGKTRRDLVQLRGVTCGWQSAY